MATSEKRAVGEADSGDAEVGSPQNKKLNIDDNPTSDKPHDYDSDDSFDSVEYYRFVDQKRDSDGFDVDSTPHGAMCAFCVYNDHSELEDDMRQQCDDFANKAVKFHNINKPQENADLEFVKLLKVNFEYMGPDGEMYFVAFSNQNDQLIPDVLMFRKRGDAAYIGQDPKLYKEWTSDCGGGGPCSC